jgi:hypothetical protein
MQIKSKADYIAGFGRHVVVILGNVVARDFEIVHLEDCPLGSEYAANFQARGLSYVGTFGMVNGQFESVFDVPLDDDVIVALAGDYARFVTAKDYAAHTPATHSDHGANWLKKLFALPDPRMN